MKTSTRHALSKILALGIVGLCVWYLFQGVDHKLLLQTLGSRPPALYVLACGLFLITLLPMCLRLYTLLRGRCSMGAAIQTVFFGSGANSLLPAPHQRNSRGHDPVHRVLGKVGRFVRSADAGHASWFTL
jgi:uncharacterized membrane protein YbhN (UPF0104 family)